MTLTNRDLLAALACGAVFVLVNLYALERAPMLFCDEGTLNEPAKELALHGVMRSMLFAGSQNFEHYYYWQPPGYPLLMAGVYSIAGFGLLQMRLPSLLLGAVTLVLVVLVSLRLFGDRRAAILAAVLLSVDPNFLLASRMGRPDTLCFALALTGVLLLLQQSASERDRWNVRISGLLMGLAGMVHPLAIIWALSGGVIILLGHRNRWRNLARFAFLAGVPTSLWLGWIFWTGSLRTFYRQFVQHASGKFATLPLWERFPAEVGKYIYNYDGALLLLILYAFGLAYGIVRFRSARLPYSWLAVLLIPILWNVLLMSKIIPTGPYYLYPVLTISIGSGILISRGLRWGDSAIARFRAVATGLAALIVLLHTLNGGLFRLWRSANLPDRANEFSIVSDTLRRYIPPNSVVWSPGNPPHEVIFSNFALADRNVRLHLIGQPDPLRFDYALCRSTHPLTMPDGFVKIAEYNPASVRDVQEPFTGFNQQGYGVTIWKSIIRSTEHDTQRQRRATIGEEH